MYKNKIISFIGDSITSFKGISTQRNECYYPTSFLSDPEDTYWAKLVKHYGFIMGANDGWSGSRIGWDGKTEVGNMVGKDKNIACHRRISELSRGGEPDYIVVYAGTNDIRREPLGNFDEVDWDLVLNAENMTEKIRSELPVNDFVHSTSSLYAGLKMLYPKAHIVALLPMWVDVEEGHTEREIEARVNLFDDTYIKVLDKFGIDHIDLRRLCTFDRRAECVGDDPSLLHPSKAGMQKIYEALVEYFDALADR